MSIIAIRAALEKALAAMTPPVLIAYENAAFSPPASGVPYQKANLLLATPDNSERGSTYQELGIFQVSLLYPLQAGPGEAAARAEMLRSVFRKGASFADSGIVVNITATPEVGAGTVDGDRFFVPVKVRFSAFIVS